MTNPVSPKLPTQIATPALHDDSTPAFLWIGKHEELVDHVMIALQKKLCSHKGCGTCSTCHAIRMQQHYAITWLYPEKQYTLEQLKVISTTMMFALEEGHQHFFILQKADALTLTCSNSLLKSIEEPPPGYHIILLTERPDQILPTIQSRCLTQSWYSDTTYIQHKQLFALFTSTTMPNPSQFLKELEASKIGERESIELLDAILAHWLQISKQALLANDTATYTKTQKVIRTLTEFHTMPPMPGSSNLFWKQLYLQLYSCL